ncbi:hypothetical protein EGY25_04300 [Brevundimonas intermedia]|uniref:Uncharacterized protein n=1 Tax=Brevundimonas intermedia TaxID=74315 RepID=A0A4Y9RZ40_9CAUL|nr:hypothetical protein [Brevundimonas intermedia]TFW14420.1 hypothetical protein EGY25_04300 [Brevundimonas intermedia]
MALNMYIEALDPRFSLTGDFQPAVPANVTGVYVFGRPPGASDSEAREIGRRNRAPGAMNGANVNVLAGTLPTVFDDYWRFAPDGPLLTNIPETERMTILILGRSSDGGFGANPNLGYLAGTYGNTQVRGFGIEMNATTSIRAVGYDSVGVKTNQASVVTSHAPWRIFRAQIDETTISLNNLTADGGAPTPTPTALVGGRNIGSQNLSIGGRIAPGSATYTKAVDIAAIITTSGTWGAGEQAAMLAQMRRINDRTDLVEGVA